MYNILVAAAQIIEQYVALSYSGGSVGECRLLIDLREPAPFRGRVRLYVGVK